MPRDVQALKGQLVFLDLQVSKVPKAEREALGFQGSRAHQAIPVKEVLPGSRVNQAFLVLQVVQEPLAGKGSQETWGLLDQLEGKVSLDSRACQEQVDPQDLLEFQALLGKVGSPVFQAPRDPKGCLASQASQEREESQAQMDGLAERAKWERKAGLAFTETWEQEEPKEPEDYLGRLERWLSFSQRGNPGILDPLEIVGFQEKEAIKEVLGCTGKEEVQEEMGHLDSTEGSPGETGSVGLLAPQAFQVYLDQEGSLVFQDFQVTRVSLVLQGSLDSQELMEQEDLKETKVTLPVSVVHLVQRVSQGAPDIKGTLEPLEIKACLEFKGQEDLQDHQDCWALLDHQGIQVIQGCLDPQGIREKRETPG